MLSDLERLSEHVSNFCQVAVVVVMNRAKRVVDVNEVADFLLQGDTDRGIDGVFLFRTAAAEQQRGNSHSFACNFSNKSFSGRKNVANALCARKLPRRVNDLSITALGLDHGSKLVECTAGGDEIPRQLLPFLDGVHTLTEIEHPAAEFERENAEVFGTTATKNIDALFDFEGVTDLVPEGLVHVGDERDHALAHIVTDFNHETSESF